MTVTKSIIVWANQKPWLTGEVYRLLKARNAAFRAVDEVGLRTARANLSRGIRDAKRQYSRGIAHCFSDSRDTRSLWQGIQTITNYKLPPRTCDSTIPLLNELNVFFAHFEAQNSTTAQKTPPPPGDEVMMLSPDSVRRSLNRINARNHHSIIPVPKKSSSILLQWLPYSRTYSYPHEVLCTTSHAPHQGCPPLLPWPLPVCISVQPLDQWHHHHCPPPSPHTSRLVCQNTVHRLQFSIQHNHPSTAHSQIGPARTQHLSVQLAVGLPYWDTSSSMVSSNTSSTITLKPPKDVCWAPSSSLCWPTTAHRHIISTFSLSLRTTWLWWVLLTTKMRQTTSARWAAWLGGAVTTISLSECGEDEGDCCWLQESAHSACSSDHQWCDCGESEQHQVAVGGLQ